MDIMNHDIIKETDKESICAQAALLGDLLAQSAEYRQYRKAMCRLLEGREQFYMLAQLRQQQFKLRLAQLMGVDIDDAEDDFSNLYATFCLEPVIYDFLYAEGRLGRLIAEVQQICGNKLELWTNNGTDESKRNQELN